MLPIARCVARQAVVVNGNSGRLLERLTTTTGAREGVGRRCGARTLVHKSFELSYTIKLHNKVSMQPEVTATGLSDADLQKLGSLEQRLNPTEEVSPEILRPVVQKISLSAVGKSSQMGRRRGNEDRIIALELRPNLLMFGILDGHGGSAAADYVKDHLPKLILDALNTEDNDLAEILKKAFVDVNHYFMTLHSDSLKTNGKKERPLTSSGTTATVCLIRDGIELVVANVGDSRAVLCQNNECVRLTVDHLPSVAAESARIVSCNGYIAESSHGTPRVNGVLEMTRSIGDAELKPFGVIAEPEVTTMQIQNNSDSFLVLTTDGVHGHLGSEEIITQISSCVDAIEAADHITDQAILFGSEDNCSAVVVPFNAWSKFASTEPRQISFTNRSSCAIAWCS